MLKSKLAIPCNFKITICTPIVIRTETNNIRHCIPSLLLCCKRRRWEEELYREKKEGKCFETYFISFEKLFYKPISCRNISKSLCLEFYFKKFVQSCISSILKILFQKSCSANLILENIILEILKNLF